MKVLCSSTPMEGVFGPFVPLGKALLAAGHDVVVATGPDLEQRVRREGFATAVAGPAAMEGAMAAMADPAVANAPGGEHWHFGAAMFGAVIAPAKLPALRQLADDYQPDLIIHAEVDIAAPLLAAERGLAVGDLRVRPTARPKYARCARRAGRAAVAVGGTEPRPVCRDLSRPLPRPLPSQPAGRARPGCGGRRADPARDPRRSGRIAARLGRSTRRSACRLPLARYRPVVQPARQVRDAPGRPRPQAARAAHWPGRAFPN